MESKLDKYLNYVERNDRIHERNKSALKWFLRECSVEGLSEVRQRKYVFGFHALFTKFMPEDLILKNATLNDLKDIVGKIHMSKYTDSTQCFLKQCIKKFFKYKHNGVYPPIVGFIKTTEKKKPSVTREDIYKTEEIREIVHTLQDTMMKAFVMTQYEGAARTGEMLEAGITQATFTDQGEFIKLIGLKNTPDRENQLVDAGAYLREWIYSHPLGGDPVNLKDPTALLFVKNRCLRCKWCLKSKRKCKSSECVGYEPLVNDGQSIANIYKQFRKACKKAGIIKRSYRLYNLRHTRITECAQFMSHEQLNRFAGWKPGSQQYMRYVHLVSEDVNKTIRRHFHMERTEKYEPILCKTCYRQNPAGSRECLNCRRPLKIEALHEKSKVLEVQEALRILAELQAEGKLEEMLKFQAA